MNKKIRLKLQINFAISYEKNVLVNNSTNSINKTNNYLSPQIIELKNHHK